MASPDASPYVDLRLYDKDAQDVFEAGLLNLRSWLPEWEPREGHTEVLLMESMALEVAEAVFAINRLPGAVTEVLLRLYGVDRDLGSPPTATFTLTAVDTSGYTIPAELRIALPVSGGEEPIVFTTDTAVLIPAGQLTATVSATGDRNTDAANGTIPGTGVELLDSVATLETVELSSYVTGGADAEDDATWYARGVQRFSRLAETLVLPAHFVSAALERPEVTRAFAADNYDPNAGGVPGDNAGHVTVAVYGEGDVLSAAQLEVLRVLFDAQAQANLAVHVVNPSISTVNVTATVVGVPGYTVAQVQANVTAALAEYLSPEQWGWGSKVYQNELIALLDRVDGVERVTSITTPSGDLTLAGVAPLARLGAANITVTGI